LWSRRGHPREAPGGKKSFKEQREGVGGHEARSTIGSVFGRTLLTGDNCQTFEREEGNRVTGSCSKRGKQHVDPRRESRRKRGARGGSLGQKGRLLGDNLEEGKEYRGERIIPFVVRGIKEFCCCLFLIPFVPG